MFSKSRVPILVGLAGLAVAAVTSAAPAASGPARATAVVKPVIGQPVTKPAQPVPGKQFTVSFKVTRSDTGAKLTTGTMICDPSVAGKVIRHEESFKNGIARLSFIVPMTAEGKALKVKLTIKADGQAATKVATFAVKMLPKPEISIGDASAAEGNSGATTFSLPVTLSFAGTKTVTVAYATADGTAVAGTDYTAANGTLTFKPGEKAKAVTVSVAGDTAVEQDESFTVTLSNPVNATLADGTATGTITNEDVAPKSGHYAGTTSQGKPISFDVSADLTSISNLAFTADLNVAEVAYTFSNMQYGWNGPIPLLPDWSISFVSPYSDAQISETVTFHGQLAVPGTASGTFRVDVAIYNVSGIGTAHASTGDVTWTAS